MFSVFHNGLFFLNFSPWNNFRLIYHVLVLLLCCGTIHVCNLNFEHRISVVTRKVQVHFCTFVFLDTDCFSLYLFTKEKLCSTSVLLQSVTFEIIALIYFCVIQSLSNIYINVCYSFVNQSCANCFLMCLTYLRLT